MLSQSKINNGLYSFFLDRGTGGVEIPYIVYVGLYFCDRAEQKLMLLLFDLVITHS